MLPNLIIGAFVVAALVVIVRLVDGRGRRSRVAARWETSDARNATRIIGDMRVTVFPSDGGWKFCLADLEDDDDPYFSAPYDAPEKAKHEALALLNGEPATYLALRSKIVQRDDFSMEKLLIAEEEIAAELRRETERAMSHVDVNITKLRPLESRIATRVRYADRIQTYFDTGSQDQLQRALSNSERLLDLQDQVAAKIAELKARKRRG